MEPGGDSEQFVTIRDVELVKEGDWPAVTGPATINSTKLASMAAAHAKGIFEHAPIKIGHFDPRFAHLDGNPALGWIENVRVAGKSLRGDLARVPKKFAPALESLYRKRSIEWEENVTGSDGQKYPAVLKAVALLGANEPAVTGLQDVMNVFAAAFGKPEDHDDNVQIAFIGDRGQEIAQCLSQLTTLFQAASNESGNDGLRIATDLGGITVADGLSEARVRELLDLDANADVEAELTRLATIKASDAGNGAEPNKDGQGEPATPAQPAEPQTPATPAEPAKPAEAAPEGEFVSKEVLAELQRQAALGVQAHEQLTREKAETEVKAAAKAGKIAPTEFDGIVDDMIENPEKTRQRLSARPAVLPMVAIGDATATTSAADDTAFVNFATAAFGGELTSIGKQG